jgi:2-hydroxychromene-2-carboxylate isomerase
MAPLQCPRADDRNEEHPVRQQAGEECLHVARRRAAKHGIPFTEPPGYPVDPDLLANRVGLVAAEQGWCPEYTKASYPAWFLENKPIGVGTNTQAVLRSLEKDPKEIIERANSEEIIARYAEETDVTRQLGIFGTPTFVVNGEIFWGDDRLEDALEWQTALSD